ncbi:hypothetical protein BRARA_I04083 [Brassica rapa]|uniref:Carbohydrate kinase PfkB domain-containing protein n=1 Tax=Brassica campestris TaxID=3711 RepID=A0A397Y1M4_BRACM|nr:hypothetical protein BRARA_I04083 [Brassica rapa]
MATSTGEKSLIVSFGEMLIDFVPTVSGVSLAEAPGFIKAPGGAPANVAIAVSRLGGRAAFVGKLGDDEFGHMLAGILKQNGVSAEGINFDTGARTALAFVTLRSDGEREFMFYRNPSADMLLRPDELNLDLIKSDEARLREVLRFANACGAITTTKKGAIPALPTESEVQSLLNGN